jgi:DUF917 family protein
VLFRSSGSATPFCDGLASDDELPRLAAVDEVDGYVATVVKLGATGTVHDWGAACCSVLDALLADAGLTRDALAAIVPGEINRSQVDRALYVCRVLGKPLLDADHVGATAVPSLALCRSVERGLPLRTAYAVVEATAGGLRPTATGLLDCGTGVRNAAELDARLRALTGHGGVAAALFLTRDLSLLYPGSVRRTIALGAALGREPVADILAFTHGERLGAGVLDRVEHHPGAGFALRTVHVGDLRVGVLNEFLFVERAGVRIAEVPAIIALVDDAGRGLLTARLDEHVGRRVHVLRLPEVDPTGPARTAEWNRLVGVYAAARAGRTVARATAG